MLLQHSKRRIYRAVNLFYYSHNQGYSALLRKYVHKVPNTLAVIKRL